jgi:hypothetical protein
MTMKRRVAFLAAIAVFAACSAASAIWSVSKTGIWPESWPKALEPLRVKSSTATGSAANFVIHSIPFTNRDKFEAAWPLLLKVKTKGAPIFLVRSPVSHWHFDKAKAGVLVHCPPGGVDPAEPSVPKPEFEGSREVWMYLATFIELVVDGEIVDLNRIRLPADTPIIDERFKDEETKTADAGGE